jgi:hypothetical protein
MEGQPLRALIDNNIATRDDSAPLAISISHPDHLLELSRNDLFGPYSFHVNFLLPLAGSESVMPPLTVQATENVLFSAAGCAVNFNIAEAPKPEHAGSMIEDFLRHAVAWSEQRNLYLKGRPLLYISSGTRPSPLATVRPRMTLAEWNRFWKIADTTSIVGEIHFVGDKLTANQAVRTDNLAPESFRLRPDSAGYRAAADGKDLGPDIDLVGPGAAYERWKKTPAYQQWLKETEQVK